MHKGGADVDAHWTQDSSQLDVIQGYLQKQSSKWGTWQKRYFCVSNQYLNYFSCQKMLVLKASCDLTDMEEDASLVGRFGGFQLNFGHTIVNVRAKDLKSAGEWVRAINQRYEHFLLNPVEEKKIVEESHTPLVVQKMTKSKKLKKVVSSAITEIGKKQIRSSSLDAIWANTAVCVKEGWLSKQSPSRFKAWQSRYFRLIDGSLYYYKSDSSSLGDFQGRILLNSACHISMDMDDNKNVIFIHTSFRKYIMKADNDNLQKDWMDSILQHQLEKRNRISLTEDDFEDEEEVVQTPQWILQWDTMDHVEHIQHVQDHLNEKFANCGDDLNLITQTCSSLIEELDDLASQCLVGECPRLDILQTKLKMYHLKFEQEIGMFLCGDDFEALTTQDILRLMDIITAYGEYLEKILGYDADLRDSLPQFSMIDNVEKMAARYLHELQDTLGTWIENIISSNFARGMSCLERANRESTIVNTSAPVDLFNMINETIIMAQASGVEPLIAPVLSCCLITLVDYKTNLFYGLERSSSGEALKGELAFLCALVNDCSSVVEHLGVLENSKIGKTGSEEGVQWEPVRVHYDEAAFQFLDLVMQMVLDDLEQALLTSKLFTKHHLEAEKWDVAANIMTRIVATLCDYLTDLQQLLLPEYFNRILKRLVQEISLIYCRQMMNATSVYSDPSIFLNEICGGPKDMASQLHSMTSKLRIGMDEMFHIKLDFEQLMNCVENFAPSAEKLFAQEIVAWKNIIDLLAVSPALFPSAVLTISAQQSHLLQKSVLTCALCCLSLRRDISVSQGVELRQSIGLKLKQKEIANKFSNINSESEQVPKNNQYAHLWPDLIVADPLKDRMRQLLGNTRAKIHREKSQKMNWQPTQNRIQRLSMDSQSDLPHYRLRAGTLSAMISKDFSVEASQKRKENRQFQIDLAEESRDENIHGFMEKKSPHPPMVWQRRWFLIHKVHDEASRKWKMSLTWHKTFNSPVKSRLFLDLVSRVDLTPSIPVRLATDGISYILAKENLNPAKLQEKKFEFTVTTDTRAYCFRALSMSEAVMWVNGLNKACREAKRISTIVDDEITSKAYEDLDMSSLRALCVSRGLNKVTKDTSRADLLQFLRHQSTLETDKEALASKMLLEEKKKMLLSRSVHELKNSCSTRGIDISTFNTKAEFVDCLAGENEASLGEQMAQLRQLIARGLLLLEDSSQEEDLDLVAVENAIGIFEKVTRESQMIGSPILEARSIHGIATAYTLSPERLDASPLMFEMASNMFFELGEMADAFSCISDAAETYKCVGQLEDAIRCLVEYDSKADTLQFAETIAHMRKQLQPQKKATVSKINTTLSRLSNYFSS